MKDRIYNLNLEEQERYFNLKYQLGIEEAHNYMKYIFSFHGTIIRLVPLFYSLAIASQVMKVYSKSKLLKKQ
jgi:hypothetical protein